MSEDFRGARVTIKNYHVTSRVVSSVLLSVILLHDAVCSCL